MGLVVLVNLQVSQEMKDEVERVSSMWAISVSGQKAPTSSVRSRAVSVAAAPKEGFWPGSDSFLSTFFGKI